MTIRARLALGLFAIAIVLLVPLVLALKASRDLDASTRRLRDQGFTTLITLNRARTELDEVRRAETNVGVFAGDTTGTYSPLDSLENRVDSVRAAIGTLRRLQIERYAAQLEAGLDSVQRLARREYDLARAGNGEAAVRFSEDSVVPAIARLEAAMRQAERGVAGDLSQRVVDAGIRADEAQQASAIAFAVAASLALLIAILIWRSIARPIQDIETGMAEVAGGNFRYELPLSPQRDDEFGRLARSFRSMALQLEQLDRLKAEFISVASHELKTPINVILGYVQLLQEEVYGPVNQRQREVLGTLEAQTSSLSRLVHQLLDVSRFEAGGGKLELRPIELEAFLGELEQTFHVLSVQRGVDFHIHRGDGLPETVHWDLDRMNEVLGNLLSNAFKFTERGGSVTLRAQYGDGEVHFEVSDTGAGIPPEQLPHVFQKFYQASNQQSAALGGTGLGLAIARQIVVAHGGTISVDSTVGNGTTFYITLPARPGQRISQPARAVPASTPA
ncbi:MAG TPA: HAMP domain-containing sensor histidine kinase [Gemmatimonadaceae bacterium]|nr:HAMP domain-containing sensor histidine kinase [Gemmatimonadaceae bacterium]